MPLRNEEEHDPRDRFGLYRLCDCNRCDGKGKVERVSDASSIPPYDYHRVSVMARCSDCRGEGRVRQEVASCESPEAVGVALVTLGREQSWEGCAFGLLDRDGAKGKKWLVLPWLPSPRNASDAGKLLRSRRTS